MHPHVHVDPLPTAARTPQLPDIISHGNPLRKLHLGGLGWQELLPLLVGRQHSARLPRLSVSQQAQMFEQSQRPADMALLVAHIQNPNSTLVAAHGAEA